MNRSICIVLLLLLVLPVAVMAEITVDQLYIDPQLQQQSNIQQQQPNAQQQQPNAQQQYSGQQQIQFVPVLGGKSNYPSKPFSKGSNFDTHTYQTSQGPVSDVEHLPLSNQIYKAGEVVEISATEKSMNDSPLLINSVKPDIPVTDKISQFGYNFFKPSLTSYSSPVDVPVALDYILGTGDRIILTVWGSIEGSYELEVNRSGDIILPKVGPVKIAGLPYGQLQQVVRTNMARVYKDFQLNVNMGRIRQIKVYVVGAVVNPGDYNLSSLTTVLSALSAAGGPTKNGTLRNINIKRGGNIVDSIDLYDFFLKGDKSRDIRLQSGDTIFVPSIGPVAGVAGNVRRPAIYELKDEKTLKDLLALADGVTSSGFLQRVQITRVDAHDKKAVADFSLDPKIGGKSLDELTQVIAIRDMDMVRISQINSLLRDSVRLEGYVLRQGDYALKSGMKISDLLPKDNLLPEFYPEAGQLIRLYPPDYHPEAVMFSPAKALAGDVANDIPLQEFDRVRIFSRKEMEEIPNVRISGEVQRPGEYRLYNNMTVRDLLILAGNPKRTAYMKNAEITRINKTGESVTSFSINFDIEQAMKGDEKNNLRLQPYDDLFIRKIPNWSERTEKYITLKGEFVFPGVYPIYKGEKLDSIIRRAGGFTDKAYLPGAKFTREHIKELQQKRMDEVLAREEVALARKQGELSAVAASKEEVEATKSALEGMLKAIAMLKTQKAEGRMVIQLPPLEKLKDSQYNFEVIGGDALEVSTDPKMVTVFGQVYNPNTFLHVSGEDVSDYLAKSGGFTRDAEQGDTYVIKADGRVVSRQMTSSFFGFGGFMSMELTSGDTLVAPQKLDRVAWIRELKDITSILANIALTAGIVLKF